MVYNCNNIIGGMWCSNTAKKKSNKYRQPIATRSQSRLWFVVSIQRSYTRSRASFRWSRRGGGTVKKKKRYEQKWAKKITNIKYIIWYHRRVRVRCPSSAVINWSPTKSSPCRASGGTGGRGCRRYYCPYSAATILCASASVTAPALTAVRPTSDARSCWSSTACCCSGPTRLPHKTNPV